MRDGVPPILEIKWLLLIHAIPPKPHYLRVKIGRRLQRLGAVAIKNSVYALPKNDEAREDFQWVAREIVAGQGDASIVDEARLAQGTAIFAGLCESFRGAEA
jgi:DNA-binding transcriptional regulator PaaX